MKERVKVYFIANTVLNGEDVLEHAVETLNDDDAKDIIAANKGVKYDPKKHDRLITDAKKRKESDAKKQSISSSMTADEKANMDVWLDKIESDMNAMAEALDKFKSKVDALEDNVAEDAKLIEALQGQVKALTPKK